jgi:hypothetical protein
MIRERASALSYIGLDMGSTTTTTKTASKDTFDKNKNVSKLTASETQRNIGSVTFFLDPRQFEESAKGRTFATTEMYLPIRDITITPNAKLSVSEWKGKSTFCLI